MTAKISCDQCGHTWEVKDGDAVSAVQVAVVSGLKKSRHWMQQEEGVVPDEIDKFHLCVECAMAMLLAFKDKKRALQKKAFTRIDLD